MLLPCFKVQQTHVGREGTAHELLPLSVLGLSGVASVLEVLQGGPKVLDIVLQLVHSPEGKQRIQLNNFNKKRTKALFKLKFSHSPP